MRRHRVAPWAASELSIRREVLDLEDDPEIAAALWAWDGSRLAVADTDAETVAAGLVALANWCDDHAEHDRHPETRRHHRWARDGLSELAGRVWAQAREASRRSVA